MSDDEPIRHAHDALVRYVYSRPDAMAIEIRRAIDPALLPYVDFASLRPAFTERSDSMLSTRRADLCYLVDLVDEGRRYPLFLALEHQSTLDLRFPCRAHVSLGDIWNEYIQAHSEDRHSVPAVMVILLAQRPAWATPARLSEVFLLSPKLRALVGHTAELHVRVDDLSGSVLDDPYAPLATRALVEIARALLYVYKNSSPVAYARLAALGPLFDIVLAQDEPLATNDIRALWKYVVSVFEAGSPVRDIIIQSVGKRAREEYMTIADQLIAQGRAAGKAEALLDVLELRFLVVPRQARERVLSTHDETRIQRWLHRALAAASVDEVFAES
jgi:hypothetical protein